MNSKKIEVLKFIIFGYGFSIEFWKWNYNPLTGDGSINKYSIEKNNSKYINPSITFTLNYNYDFKFIINLNRC